MSLEPGIARIAIWQVLLIGSHLEGSILSSQQSLQSQRYICLVCVALHQVYRSLEVLDGQLHVLSLLELLVGVYVAQLLKDDAVLLV